MTDEIDDVEKGKASIRPGEAPQDREERIQLLLVGLDMAEKLDELERLLDPAGSAPRHAALVLQRLRAIRKKG